MSSYFNLKNVDFYYHYYSSLGIGLFNKNARRIQYHALKNLNLEIKDGDRIGLFGKNGAGKSTLLKLMAGIYPPESGEIDSKGRIYSFFGRDVGVNPFLSGYENLYIRGLLLNIPIPQIKEKLEEIAEFTELGEDLKRPVSTYSSGMKARLTFAMLMFVDADILLIDEGLGAGDRFFIEKARLFVDNLLQQSKILVFASHHDHLLDRFCNKGLLVDKGEIVKFGDFQEVKDLYNGLF